MRLRSCSLLTDENVHPEVVRALRQDGFDILDTKECGLVGSSDLTILRRAYEESRIVLTHDSDFGQLAVASLEPVLGIVYLRPGHFDPSFTMTTLATLFDEIDEVTPPFILVAERVANRVKIRIRRL